VHPTRDSIGASEIGQKMERATLIAEDSQRDTALLRLQSPRSVSYVTLETSMVPIGTGCGSLGFPLAAIVFLPTGPSLSLAELFQGANISALHAHPNHLGQPLDYYETDAAMYGGSSGCPGFLIGGNVFAMHIASVLARGKAVDNVSPVNGSLARHGRGDVFGETRSVRQHGCSADVVAAEPAEVLRKFSLSFCID
jgi:S1-C subfamily serine protease